MIFNSHQAYIYPKCCFPSRFPWLDNCYAFKMLEKLRFFVFFHWGKCQDHSKGYSQIQPTQIWPHLIVLTFSQYNCFNNSLLYLIAKINIFLISKYNWNQISWTIRKEVNIFQEKVFNLGDLKFSRQMICIFLNIHWLKRQLHNLLLFIHFPLAKDATNTDWKIKLKLC